jgi:uncharacterized protein (DUF486 family)
VSLSWRYRYDALYPGPKEAIALLVFVLMAKVLFRGETLERRHYLALLLVLAAVWLAT